LRSLTAAPVLTEAATVFERAPVQIIGYASTTSAYAVGFDAEVAMVSRRRQCQPDCQRGPIASNRLTSARGQRDISDLRRMQSSSEGTASERQQRSNAWKRRSIVRYSHRIRFFCGDC
jgi:hypothetical protein